MAGERGAAAAAVAGLAPGVKKLRGGTRERSLSFIFVLIGVKAPNMSMGDFQNVVVNFKRVTPLLQNAETCQTCKSE